MQKNGKLLDAEIVVYKAILAAMKLFEEYENETRIVFWFML